MNVVASASIKQLQEGNVVWSVEKHLRILLHTACPSFGIQNNLAETIPECYGCVSGNYIR